VHTIPTTTIAACLPASTPRAPRRTESSPSLQKTRQAPARVSEHREPQRQPPRGLRAAHTPTVARSKYRVGYVAKAPSLPHAPSVSTTRWMVFIGRPASLPPAHAPPAPSLRSPLAGPPPSSRHLHTHHGRRATHCAPHPLMVPFACVRPKYTRLLYPTATQHEQSDVAVRSDEPSVVSPGESAAPPPLAEDEAHS